MTDRASAEIFDRGFRRYRGERTGMPGAVRTLVTSSVQRCLGIHRPARFKIVPVIVVLLAYVPAIVYLGIAALLPATLADAVTPEFYEYFGTTNTALFLFASFVGPELLCTDRRTGMLGVYLASPLTRGRYVAAKALSIGLLMLLVSLGPNLVFFFAISAQGGGPDSVGSFLGTLASITAAAAMIAVYFAAISMAVSATTDRSGVAIAATLGVIVGSTVASGVLVGALDYSKQFRLFSLLELPVELAPRFFGEATAWTTAENPTWTLAMAWIAVVGACFGWVAYRYQHLQVRR